MFSETLKTARLDAGMTQEEAASKASVSKATWQNLESGRTEPRLSVLRRIAPLFGWSLPWDDSESRVSRKAQRRRLADVAA